MIAVKVASFVLCSLLVFHATAATPIILDDSVIVDPNFSYNPHEHHQSNKNKDIVIDYSVSANAEIKVSESTTEALLKAMINMMQQMHVEQEQQDVQIPVEPVPEQQPESDPVPEQEVHSRSKRATCDLLSATGVQSSACAAHCILLGHMGGYCNSKLVCVCRN